MNLREKAYALRQVAVNTICRAGSGHVGGDMSVMDILVSLYYDRLRISPETADDPDRDRFVMSKGHCIESLYAVLADRGFITREQLDGYFTFGSLLIGHPNNKLRGIEMNSGALGHGLSVAVGMAIAGKMQKRPFRVYTVMGDGEVAEGSVWEAVECAAHYGLDNLCAIVDQNGLQISGTTEQVMNHRDLAERFRVYGWHAVCADGHDLDSLHDAFDEAERTAGRPTAVIASTVKGKGISFMENRAQWHHKVPTEQERLLAIEELEKRRKEYAL